MEIGKEAGRKWLLIAEGKYMMVVAQIFFNSLTESPFQGLKKENS